MAQIFVSHSKRDRDVVAFFGTLFGTTNVKGVFKEIEGFSLKYKSLEIIKDIKNSAAIFILLGPHVNDLQHTRDWVVWEGALAAPLRKEIWVFEPYEYLGKIDVIIPYVDHYVIYEQSDKYREYIRKIIQSYDDSQVLPSTFGGMIGGAIVGGIIETLLSKGKRPPLIGPILGGLGGGVGGAILADPSSIRPKGVTIRCPSCGSEYRIHMKIPEIRCPCCNAILKINWDDINDKTK